MSSREQPQPIRQQPSDADAVGTIPDVPGVRFREMRREDVASGLRLCRLSHWNQVASDWEQFLAREPHGAVVAERDARIIGSVATLRYGRDLAWVAMVLVDPAERGRGIGMALLHRGLALVADVPVVGLDATPAGQALYVKLGFVEACRLTRLQREPAAVTRAAEEGPRPVRAADWPWMLDLDRRACGYDRGAMLRWLADGAPAYAWVEQSASGVGFVLGRHGHNFEHLGPVVAPDGMVAARLVGRCVADLTDRRVILDAPDGQPGWQEWLGNIGFVEQRPFSRMYRGPHAGPACGAELFASIGPEFG
jgi:GNAT superfamily N-acetyltransferase